MKRTVGMLISGAALFGLVGCAPQPSAPAAGPQDRVKRGVYLVGVLGCDDCHTPKTMGPQGPEPDMTRRLIGLPEGTQLPAPPALPPGPWGVVSTMDLLAWSGPWGISYGINLTPDQDTGIGIWTEDMFIKAIRTGKHMSAGRPILPPMPVADFKLLTDDDLKAVFAFLRTLPPTKNHVPDPVIAPPPPEAPAAEQPR